MSSEISKLKKIASNLWWSWQSEAIALFKTLGQEKWDEVNHNPYLLLERLTHNEIQAAIINNKLSTTISRLYKLLVAIEDEIIDKPKAAYFCAEYGIHESFLNYSGGLGVLAGDHLKSCSDQKIPLTAIGLLYKQGYFHQQIDYENATQNERYEDINFNELPLEVVQHKNSDLIIEIPMSDHFVYAKVWLLKVGRIKLFLLDTNIDENNDSDKWITDRLYGGDHEHRIQQEIILGIGGVKLLNKLKIKPKVYHMNEGHAAFSVIERVANEMTFSNKSLAKTIKQIKKHTMFTTHTPVPAGNQVYPDELVSAYINPYLQKTDAKLEEILRLGKIEHDEAGFGMTVFALRVSSAANGVSKLHGKVSRQMWKHVFHLKKTRSVPIGHITNGVHLPSWLHSEYKEIYNKAFSANWMPKAYKSKSWKALRKIKAQKFFRAKNKCRKELVDYINTTKNNPSIPDFKEDILTIGFARRFATYKRATLILQEKEHLKRILQNSDKPIQIVFAGKAHPKDMPGKSYISELLHFIKDNNVRIYFLENYSIDIGKKLTQGVDVWLNNPRRPHEASGTSGMKVPINGGLNLSVLDGWWAEAYRPSIGWSIGDGKIPQDEKEHDLKDMKDLYDKLENSLIPLFYKTNSKGINKKWIKKVVASTMYCAPRFHSDRMVTDYYKKYYKTFS